MRALALVAGLLATTAHADVLAYKVVVKNVYPHDPAAFTQGLLFEDGVLYESTGRNGQSSVRKVELTTGRVLEKRNLPASVFGEGIAYDDGDIVCLTWRSHVGFVFDGVTFEEKRRFALPGEGWGITGDERSLYLSDGTSSIRVLDPTTLGEVRRIAVTADGKPVTQLNELEWIDGQIFANVWQTDTIARIDPVTGHVLGWIDLSGLLPADQRGPEPIDAVLNGIAFDRKHHRIFVTGKLWPKLFEIEIAPAR